jgi:hypothetical protein
MPREYVSYAGLLIPAGSIPTAALADGSVTNTKLAADVALANIAASRGSLVVRGASDTNSGYGLQVQNNSITQNNMLVRNDGQIQLVQGGQFTFGPGAALSMPAGLIATAFLADSSVTTAKLAANAASVPLMAHTLAAGWSTTTTAVWMNSGLVTPSFTAGGGECRIDFIITISHSATNAFLYTAVGVDSGVVDGTHYINFSPNANSFTALGFSFYITLAAGSHTVSWMFYNGNAGTINMPAGYNKIYVHEMKR